MSVMSPDRALNPEEVQVGTANGPGIYLAEVGTPPPASTREDWGPDWEVLGYLSDDGPTVGQSTDSEEITPWQSITPIRTVITSRSVTLQFVLWQLNQRTLGLYFDADVPEVTTDEFSLDISSETNQHRYAIGIDSRDSDRVLRVVFFRATLSDAGDMQIQRGAAVPLDCTLSALDDGGRLARVMVGPANGSGNGNGAEGYAARRVPAARNGAMPVGTAREPVQP